MVKKRYIVAMVVILTLVVLGLWLSDPIKESLQGRAMSVSGVALNGMDRMRTTFEGISEEVQTNEQLRDRVDALEALNEKLEMRQRLYRDLKGENSRLRAMLAFKEESPFDLLAARVISRDASSWWNTVDINRGSYGEGGRQMDRNLPVVSPRGVVGKVGEVGYSTSNVVLLVDESCKIAARIKETNAKGLVVGEGTLDDGRPRARMKYIAKDEDVAVGQLVETSGLGGVFPPGLIIGRIVEVPPLSSKIDFGLHREAIIEPNVDMSDLKELFIILDAPEEAEKDGAGAKTEPKT
ncbi:MAG: rod shape-determining protein MreC [Verrucomicrobiota bacterium]